MNIQLNNDLATLIAFILLLVLVPIALSFLYLYRKKLLLKSRGSRTNALVKKKYVKLGGRYGDLNIIEYTFRDPMGDVVEGVCNLKLENFNKYDNGDSIDVIYESQRAKNHVVACELDGVIRNHRLLAVIMFIEIVVFVPALYLLLRWYLN